jgi:glycosyltransferase involved in cell wall biosynthesis
MTLPPQGARRGTGSRQSRSRPLRVGVLTGPYTSTYDAQLTALRRVSGATVAIVYKRAAPTAPYDDARFASLNGATAWQDEIPEREIADRLDDLAPDALLVTSWNYGPYVRLARRWRNRAIRIMVMDNPWLGTLKQRAGMAISPFYIRPSFDVAFLPNDRQRIFARKLGFGDEDIWTGVYCCDQPSFESFAEQRRGLRRRSFLYVGRLVATKGLDVLLDAYQAYRELVDDPWPLRVAGTGPLHRILAGVEGVVPIGFQQPDAMPQVFGEAGCFVLPSVFEPWGIVVHEAAASGLPIVCTVACGASLDLVRDGYNGFVVPPGNSAALTDALVAMTTMDEDRRRNMGRASTVLSRQLTPERWAASVHEKARAWLDARGHDLQIG